MIVVRQKPVVILKHSYPFVGHIIPVLSAWITYKLIFNIIFALVLWYLERYFEIRGFSGCGIIMKLNL